MHILFVSAVLPYPLHSGGQIRIYNLLKRLSKQHTITLVSFIRSEEERAFEHDLGFCDSVKMVMRGRAWQPKYYIGAILGKYPFLLNTYDNARMKELLEDITSQKKYDLVHIEPFYVMPSLPELHIPLVISEHNVEYQVYESYAHRFPVPILRTLLLWDVHKLRRWERIAWKRASRITAVSSEDASVMELYLHHTIDVVPNGVDLAAFPFREPLKRVNPTILFVGNFRWYPNRDAANTLLDHIWPKIHNVYPLARLSIVGREIPSLLKKRVLRAGGEIHDTVDDIARVYQDADILVAPHAISGGTKFKMLEAMATGLPIVTTKEGMFGLSVTPGLHYFLAQTPEDFVMKVRHIWDTPEEAEKVAQYARRLVEAQYSWDHIADAQESVWKKAYET